jgi:Ca2+-binding EF-hand superfamily protein
MPKALKHPWLSKKADLFDRKPDPDILNSAQANLVQYADSGDFKKLAMNVISKSSATEDKLGLRKVFDEFDSENNGTITFAEFKKALEKANYTDKEIETIFRKVAP